MDLPNLTPYGIARVGSQLYFLQKPLPYISKRSGCQLNKRDNALQIARTKPPNNQGKFNQGNRDLPRKTPIFSKEKFSKENTQKITTKERKDREHQYSYLRPDKVFRRIDLPKFWAKFVSWGEFLLKPFIL